MPVDEFARVDPAAVAERAPRRHAPWCSIGYANNEVGTVQDAAAIAAAAGASHPGAPRRGAGRWLAIPRRQGPRRRRDLDRRTQARRPEGNGRAGVRGRVPVEPLLHGGGQEHGLRSGTEDVAGAVGLATALDLAEAEREVAATRVCAIRDAFIARVLATVPTARLTGHPLHRLPGLRASRSPARAVRPSCSSSNGAGSSRRAARPARPASDDPSHVLVAMGIAPEVAQTAVRFTLATRRAAIRSPALPTRSPRRWEWSGPRPIRPTASAESLAQRRHREQSGLDRIGGSASAHAHPDAYVAATTPPMVREEDAMSLPPKVANVKGSLLEILGAMSYGERLPAERELAERLDVSRMTLRRAMDDLVVEGVVARRRGAGAFLTRPRLSRRLAMTSFTEDMIRRGRVPSTRTLEFRQRKADRALSQRLRVPIGEQVFAFSRLRLGRRRAHGDRAVRDPAAPVVPASRPKTWRDRGTASSPTATASRSRVPRSTSSPSSPTPGSHPGSRYPPRNPASGSRSRAWMAGAASWRRASRRSVAIPTVSAPNSVRRRETTSLEPGPRSAVHAQGDSMNTKRTIAVLAAATLTVAGLAACNTEVGKRAERRRSRSGPTRTRR